MNIHKITLEDYEMYTREEIAQQITDCEKAQQKLRKKKWENEAYPHILKAIDKEMRAYEVEEMKLCSVLELIDITGRGY